jgi:hypothetical protein
MEYYSLKCLIRAVALGGLSAVSLPLVSVVGLRSNPRPICINSGRFRAGVLLAALSNELAGLSTLAGFLVAISFKLLE